MTNQTKKQIADALKKYMDLHNISQTDVATGSGVNAAYIINIRKGMFTIKSGDRTIDIAPKYFNRLASFIGINSEEGYWETKPTQQFKAIINGLKEAKETGEIAVLIGETGCGKTYVLDLFKKKNPVDVYTLKVGSSDNLSDLVDKIITVLKIDSPVRSKSARLRLIAKSLIRISEDGYEPVLVFDEAENMKIPALCALKELFDLLNTICSLVLIGTHQLLTNVDKLRKKDRQGMPQLYRRIKYRIIRIPAIDRSYPDFMKEVKDNELRKWLQRNCENYGELHDILVPARRQAESMGKELTFELVKAIFRIAA